jgi:phage terminase small subunit
MPKKKPGPKPKNILKVVNPKDTPQGGKAMGNKFAKGQPAVAARRTIEAHNEEGLTPQQERFCEEYLIDLNQGKAALRAGYCHTNYGVSLMDNPRVRAKIDHLKMLRSKRMEISADRVLAEMACIAFSNKGDIFDFSDGTLKMKRPSEIPEHAIRSISSMKVKKYLEGNGDFSEEVETIEIQQYDKPSTLVNLLKHVTPLPDKALKVEGNIQHQHTGQVATIMHDLSPETRKVWLEAQQKLLAGMPLSAKREMLEKMQKQQDIQAEGRIIEGVEARVISDEREEDEGMATP